MPTDHPSPHGARIGRALRDLLAEKDVAVAAEKSRIDNAAKAEYHTWFMESAETHFTPIVQELVADLLDQPDLPRGLRKVLKQASEPGAQFDWLLQLFITGAALMFNIGTYTRPGIQKVLNLAWQLNQDVPLTPEEAAVGVLKGWLTEAEGESEAALNGTPPSRFQWMVDIQGNPPPLQEGMEAVRRGFMDLGRFASLVRESRYRPEWLDIFIDLMYGPPTPSSAIAAAVEGHLDLGSAQAIVAQGGIDPKHFGWLYDTAGRPPGTEEMIKLWRRGVVAQADVETAIRESNVKNKYIPAILQTRLAIPPLFQINRLLTAGAITPQQATTWVLDDGYDATVAAGMVAAAGHTKVAGHKALSESMVADGYKLGVLDAPTATADLVNLGYDATEAAFILSVADHQVSQAQRSAAVTHFRTLYVNGRIDRNTATTDLTQLGLSGNAIASALAIWDLEKVATVRKPTVAQLGAFLKKSLITGADMHQRLVEDGYSDADASLFVTYYGG